MLGLGVQLDALDQAQAEYAANGAATPQAEAAEEQRLATWRASVLNAIAAARPSSPAGWRVKLAAVEHCNRTGGLTPRDRITEAETRADALAWALVADLLAERAGA